MPAGVPSPTPPGTPLLSNLEIHHPQGQSLQAYSIPVFRKGLGSSPPYSEAHLGILMYIIKGV